MRETKDRNGKSVLESCTKESIAFALQKMIVLGLNPIKKQCDFIAYGDQLQCSPEYTANEMLAKRYGVKEIHKKLKSKVIVKKVKATGYVLNTEFPYTIPLKNLQRIRT